VLASSHILTELDEIADRVVLVSGGQTIGEHSMADLSERRRFGYRIRATDPAALAPALAELIAAEDAVAVSVHAAGIEIGPLAQEQAADLLAGVLAVGVRVVAFEPAGSHLESVHLAMTEERR
jgi:ABC-2 type transport system ATP-binding protein